MHRAEQPRAGAGSRDLILILNEQHDMPLSQTIYQLINKFIVIEHNVFVGQIGVGVSTNIFITLSQARQMNFPRSPRRTYLIIMKCIHKCYNALKKCSAGSFRAHACNFRGHRTRTVKRAAAATRRGRHASEI